MATAKELLDSMLVGERDYSNAKLLTSKELLQCVRYQAPGFKIMLSIALDMPTVSDGYFQDGFRSAIQLSPRDAVKMFGDNCQSVLEHRGGRFRCYVTEFTMFDKTRRTFWISQ
jgi:hypothetical protein